MMFHGGTDLFSGQSNPLLLHSQQWKGCTAWTDVAQGMAPLHGHGTLHEPGAPRGYGLVAHTHTLHYIFHFVLT